MVADQPVGIARAVVLLVVAERDQRPHAHVLRRAAFEDLVSDHRVAAHHLPFGVVQLGGLEQDLVRDADLADVVQRRGELDGLHLLAVQADGGGDEARVARHADQVVAGLLVAELARAGEAQQRLLLALPHFARRILDHVLEQAAPVLERELLAAQGEQVAAARQAFARVHRLGEEIGDAGVERGVAHLAVVVHRDHDDRHVLVARQSAQALHELDAVHVGHHVIDQHQVGNVAGGPHHRVDRPGEALDRHALVQAAHHLLQDGASGRLVVDHHHGVARRRQRPHLRLGHWSPVVQRGGLPGKAYPPPPRVSSKRSCRMTHFFTSCDLLPPARPPAAPDGGRFAIYHYI
jgi:hypothetical protein